MNLNSLHAIHRSAPMPLVAAPWRSAAFLCAVGMASLLSACGGGGGSDTARNPGIHSVSGTLSGLANGQTIDLSQGSETLTLSADGAFKFGTLIPQGGSYEVKLSGAQPAWQSCSINNATGSAVNANVGNVEVSCVSADMKATGALNDTGIDGCSENITTPSVWVNNAVCNAINWVGNLWGEQQDAYFGRDKQAREGTLTKVGGGMTGFDFTKIGASGKVLVKQGETWSDNGTEAAGTQWDCVRDNVTGLVWEVKRNDLEHLRHMAHRYSWYNQYSTMNGGNAGYEMPERDLLNGAVVVTGPTCTGVADVNKCNTQSYVAAVNEAGLCGKTDWRMPTVDELRNLAHTGRNDPAIDTNYFPNTVNHAHWSSSPYAISAADQAYSVFFTDGFEGRISKSFALPVRLVRSGH